MKQLHGRALDEGETEGASVLIDEDRREMIISGTVDGAMFNTVCYGLGMLEAKKGPITVYINTCGGSGYDGVGIYDRLRLCKNEIVGIAVGACMSAGMAILMGCGQYGRFLYEAGHTVQMGCFREATAFVG